MAFSKQSGWQSKSRKNSNKPRKPPKVNAEILTDAALNYINRYQASTQRLRTVLQRRIRKALDGQPAEQRRVQWAEHLKTVDSIVERLTHYGQLNDEKLALEHALTLQKKGYSRVVIEKKLRSYQFDYKDIRKACDQLQQESAEAELLRACRYVRRRRLGPMREGFQDFKQRQKDYQAIVRAGFPFAVAQQITRCRSLEDFEIMEAEAEEMSC